MGCYYSDQLINALIAGTGKIIMVLIILKNWNHLYDQGISLCAHRKLHEPKSLGAADIRSSSLPDFHRHPQTQDWSGHECTKLKSSSSLSTLCKNSFSHPEMQRLKTYFLNSKESDLQARNTSLQRKERKRVAQLSRKLRPHIFSPSEMALSKGVGSIHKN